MSHDEIRVANWCLACQSRKRTPGQLLAENARRCTSILKAVNPQARIVVWSDMFDPHHNAVDNYYLVNGSLKGSWEGLAHDVVIANWNGGKAAESLKFFADRGHPQIIAGYYDGDDLDELSAMGCGRAAGQRGRRFHVYHLAGEVRPARAVRESRPRGPQPLRGCAHLLSRLSRSDPD